MTVQELEVWFSTAPKPDMPVFLNAAVQVLNYETFLQSHFAPLKANPDSKINVPLKLRLEQMKLIIESNI